MDVPVGKTASFRCILCFGTSATDFADNCVDLYLDRPGMVEYVQCNQCGLVQQRQLPADIASLYDAYPIHAEKSRLHVFLQRLLLSKVYTHPKQLAPKTLLLDYGCGDGWYLQWCKELGVSAVGFEADNMHAKRLSDRLQLPVYSKPESLIADYAGRFDLITLHFVVEHLADIRGTLSQLVGLLRPGGAIRFVVPNIDSWEYKLFGKKWHNLDPPRHISFPDARHAQMLAKELELVYETEQMVSCPNGVAGSIATLLTGHFRHGLFLAAMPLAVIFTRLFPSGSRAYTLRAAF